MEYKLFVKNVPYNCTDAEFDEFVKSKYSVNGTMLIHRKNFDGSLNLVANRGYGVVTAPTQEMQEKIISDDIVFFGRKLICSKYENKQKNYNLHVFGIPNDVSEKELFDTFSKFGDVSFVKKDFDVIAHKYKGSAIVSYDNDESFNNVLCMHTVPIRDTILVSVVKRFTHKRYAPHTYPKRQYVAHVQHQLHIQRQIKS